MKNGIVIAGNLIVDHVKMCDTFPRPGMLTNIRDVSDCIGGCAGNTLCDLGKIDPSVPLKCVGKIGEDADGKYVLETLENTAWTQGSSRPAARPRPSLTS